MTIWFDRISLTAKIRRPGPARRLAQAIATDIRGAVSLHVFERLRCWRRRSKGLAELGMLDNRMLRDIGIHRGEIPEWW